MTPKKPGRFRPLREEVTYLPNILTLARIASLPLILITIDNYSRVLSFVSALIFTAGGVSDILDGYIARKRGLESVLGAFLDPLADKLIILGTLVFLTARGRVPDWLVVILLSRELAITVLRSIAASYGLVIKAGAGGKAKTLLQTVGVTFLLVYFPYPLLFFPDVVFDFHVIGLGFIYASLFLSLWSAGEYIRFFIQAAEEKHRTHPKDPA